MTEQTRGRVRFSGAQRIQLGDDLCRVRVRLETPANGVKVVGSAEGSATLELFGAPHEEIDALAPIRIGRGYRFTFGYTVDDLETLKELRP